MQRNGKILYGKLQTKRSIVYHKIITVLLVNFNMLKFSYSKPQHKALKIKIQCLWGLFHEASCWRLLLTAEFWPISLMEIIWSNKWDVLPNLQIINKKTIAMREWVFLQLNGSTNAFDFRNFCFLSKIFHGFVVLCYIPTWVIQTVNIFKMAVNTSCQ